VKTILFCLYLFCVAAIMLFQGNKDEQPPPSAQQWQ